MSGETSLRREPIGFGPDGNDRRRIPDADRKRLFPGEIKAMRRPHPNDAAMWIDVYLQLLEAHRQMLESAPPELVEPLSDEAERIGRRIDDWRERQQQARHS